MARIARVETGVPPYHREIRAIRGSKPVVRGFTLTVDQPSSIEWFRSP